MHCCLHPPPCHPAVPRSFKLLDELEKSEKGNLASQTVSYGLADQEDIFMHRWNGTLIMDDNILSLDIVCADEYPHKPPQARFSPPIQWDGAEADGTVRESFGAAHAPPR